MLAISFHPSLHFVIGDCPADIPMTSCWHTNGASAPALYAAKAAGRNCAGSMADA